MAIDQNDTTAVVNPPVPPNPALPPGNYDDSVASKDITMVDDDDVELVDYNEGLNPEEIAALEAAKIQTTKVALRDSVLSQAMASP